MPALKRFAGFEIRMYFNDHAPPHVHVISPDGEARVAIRTGDVMTVSGRVTRRMLDEAKAWVASERDRLLAEWSDLN